MGRELPAEHYDEKYGREYADWRYDPVYSAVIDLLREIHAKRVLDVGCGTGRLGHLLQKEGIGYRGFDFSKTAIRQGLERYPGLDLFVGNVYGPSPYGAAGDYDAYIAIETLEHVDDIEVISRLPPGATLIASMPNFDSEGHVRHFRTAMGVRRHFRRFLRIDRMLRLGPFPEAAWWARIWVFRGSKGIQEEIQR